MANKKPYKKDNKNVKRTKKVKKDNLENTIKIRIDNERLNDTESLDTSFLEGRVNSNAKSKLLSDNKKKNINIFGPLKTIFTIIVILLFILGIVSIFNNIDTDSNSNLSSNSNKNNKVVEKNTDYNYLFIGDFHTYNINFDEYDFHYVKSCGEDFGYSNYLDDMKNKIYNYNPTHVFIEIGINDLNDEDNSSVVNDLEKMVKLIKENRPDALIYVESIYPINKEVEDYDDEIIDDYIDNKMIKNVNSEIKKVCTKYDILYLDIYTVLSDDKGEVLNEDYTDNGIYLNDKGYKEVKKVIKKVLGR